jgi:DNA repair protein RecN (Recombination protein N)
MIEKLYIKNYLIIENAEILFSEGLNILTGETGAGKTIILDALSLILGERADYSLLRKEDNKLIVEGHFIFKSNNEVDRILKELEIEKNHDGYLIIRRELSKKGLSRNFINDTPVNISDLKKLGDIIIDIHSQNEHQSLLNSETHLGIIDNFMGENDLLKNYRKKYKELSDTIEKFEDIINRKNELTEKRDYLNFQLKEINNVNPSESEDENLEKELKKLENSEDISLALTNSINSLYENDINAITLISNALKELKKISEYDTEAEKISEDIENARILIKESSESLIGNLSNLNYDPVRIEQIRERLSALSFLKKKYNLNLNGLISKANEIQKELELVENFNIEVESLQKNIYNLKSGCFETAKKISEQRKTASKKLSKKINEILNEVGLESAEFKSEFNLKRGNEEDLKSVKQGKEFVKLTYSGIDDVEFLVKVNKGSEFSLLKKSASGGEVSRIMLAIKTALSEKDKIPILVFDEIDAGISGRIAQKVGRILKNLASTHQLICITHLPQIAAMSQKHFYVTKKDFKGKTIAEISSLSDEEKITEVAKLISGEKITEAATQSARELINSR